MQDIETKKPKLVLMAFPCSPWSNLTSLPEGPGGLAKVQERQDRDRPFLRFVRDEAKVAKGYGGAWLIENPRWSRAWGEPELKELIKESYAAEVDHCMHGLTSKRGGAHWKPT
eukprot:812766-Pyramimonas_sp.AAC.1